MSDRLYMRGGTTSAFRRQWDAESLYFSVHRQPMKKSTPSQKRDFLGEKGVPEEVVWEPRFSSIMDD